MFIDVLSLFRNPQDAESGLFKSWQDEEPRFPQGSVKFLAVEPVLLGMGQQMPKQEISVKGRVDFFKIKRTPIFQDA